MFESAVVAHALGQNFLTRMSKRRVPEVMGERDRFSQIFVDRKSARDGAADRCDLYGMRQARAQMIARAVEKNLRFIFEPAKRARMNDARPVALKFRPVSVTRLRIFAALRFARFLRERRERCPLGGFHLLARLPISAHAAISSRHAKSVRSLSGPRATVARRGALPAAAPAYRKAPGAAQ